MYFNVVPQYKCNNNDNWNRVEDSVRQHAKQFGVSLTVITGGHGQLHFKNIADKDVPIFLADNKVIVPKFMWKIVHLAGDTNSAIVFVSLNSPSASDMLKECNQYICNNFFSPLFNEIKRGYTACCKVTDFIKYVEVPADMHTSNLLVNDLL